MIRLKTAVGAFVRDEEGATMVEYGLMIALIAAACMATVKTLGTNMNTMFTSVSGNIPAAGS